VVGWGGVRLVGGSLGDVCVVEGLGGGVAGSGI
jgi:hypothetical protein